MNDKNKLIGKLLDSKEFKDWNQTLNDLLKAKKQLEKNPTEANWKKQEIARKNYIDTDNLLKQTNIWKEVRKETGL